MAVLTDYIIAKRATMQPSATTKAPVIAVILRRRACSAILFRLSSIAWCYVNNSSAASIACRCI